jgi:hypothetical protein
MDQCLLMGQSWVLVYSVDTQIIIMVYALRLLRSFAVKERGRAEHSMLHND